MFEYFIFDKYLYEAIILITLLPKKAIYRDLIIIESEYTL